MRLADTTMRPGVRFAVQWGLVGSLIAMVLSFFDGFEYMRSFGMFVAFVSMLIAANEWRMIASQLGLILFDELRGDVRTKLHQVVLTVRASESIAAGDAVCIDSKGEVRRARGSDG